MEKSDRLGALQELAPAIPAIFLNRFRLTGLPEENARRAIIELAVLVSQEVKFSTEPFTLGVVLWCPRRSGDIDRSRHF